MTVDYRECVYRDLAWSPKRLYRDGVRGLCECLWNILGMTPKGLYLFATSGYLALDLQRTVLWICTMAAHFCYSTIDFVFSSCYGSHMLAAVWAISL